MPDNVIDFKVPKKPRVKEKEPLPDQRKLAVIPIRADTILRIHDMVGWEIKKIRGYMA